MTDMWASKLRDYPPYVWVAPTNRLRGSLDGRKEMYLF